jgi:hypothetical protein
MGGCSKRVSQHLLIYKYNKKKITKKDMIGDEIPPQISLTRDWGLKHTYHSFLKFLELVYLHKKTWGYETNLLDWRPT